MLRVRVECAHSLPAATSSDTRPTRIHSFSSPPRLCTACHLLPTPQGTLALQRERIQIKLLPSHVTSAKFLDFSKP